MKTLKLFAASALVLSMASCSSVRHTSTTVQVDTNVVANATADLQVAQKKISYTLKPTRAMKRAGEKAVINTAIAEALRVNGDADVLVGFQYEIKKKSNMFGRKSIKYVTVEGYPATYVNITPTK